MIGKEYGRWTVKTLDISSTKKHKKWFCKCSCGNISSVYETHLKSGKSRSCGCLIRELTSARNKTLTGPKNHNWGKRREETSQWGKRREMSSSWKGGRTLGGGGYILIYSPDYHNSTNKYVFEHILIMEQMLGRPLQPGEVVHHCDGDKTHNQPYNLRLFATGGEHVKFHAKLAKDGIKTWRPNRWPK
jgi:hypothetical protein